MDTKRRCTIVLGLLVTICAALWFLGSKELKEGALDILLRVTIFFAIFRLAYDDLIKLLKHLKGPTGVLVGIALAFAIISGPSVRVMLPLIVGLLVVMGTINSLRRNLRSGSYDPNRTQKPHKKTRRQPRD